jgi:threonylcarbamoyladenosine tRNA methylthiotransferase MtaB
MTSGVNVVQDNMDERSLRTASFKTLGCRLNQAEMDALAFRLQEKGVRILPFGEPADLTVINTCTVTHGADQDSRYAIRTAIRKSPRGRVVVTGCYAQMSPEAVKAIDGVDLVLGNDEKLKLLEYLNPDFREFQPDAIETPVTESKTRANLKIQDGCDYHCSFCIIPFARGRARSVPFGDVVRETENLVARGFLEIILTGVNIGTYCAEENGRPRRFVDLVDRLQQIDGLARLRISSIEPNTVTDALLRLMNQSNVICPHLHIPIQSASDPILTAMRRKCRRARLERLLDRIRALLPEAGVGTDVIVGFPGETDERFEDTLRFLASAGFSYLHIFPFSGREGTAADKMADAVDPALIRRRAEVLKVLDHELRLSFARLHVGRTLSVLFERPDRQGRQEGLTPNYLRVKTVGNFPMHGILPGRISRIEGENPVPFVTI